MNLRVERSMIRRFIESKLSYAYGSSLVLNLNEDSTYAFISCSDTIKGKWLVASGILTLFRKDVKASDTLKFVPYLSYKVSRNRLERKDKGYTPEREKMRLIDILEKVEESE